MARQVFATYTDGSGESREFSVEEIRSALGDRPGLLSELVKESYTVKRSPDGSFAAIDLHPEGLFSRLHDQLVAVPLIGFPGVALKPGRYYALYDVVHDNDKTLTGIDPRESNGIFLVADKEQLEGDYDALMAVTLHADYEEGNMEVFAFAIGEDQQSLATVHDFTESLTALAALCLTMEGGAAEPEGEEGKTPPKQDTIKPRTQVDPNSKLANRITDLLNGETVNLGVSGPTEKKVVTTVVTLEYEGEGIELAKPMTQYDREVHNAVTTLWKAGNTSFTARQVWHTLTGTDVKSPPSREQLARIEESIDKQRFTRAVVDFTEEARGRELTLDGEQVTAYKIDAYMLNAEKHAIETANGRTVEGYTITRPPVLYQHASTLGQVITYPMRYLAAGSVGQNSEENIVIRKYLLRRIGMAKGKGKVPPRIKYSSVYDKAGIAEPDKKQRKRINDFVISCLEALAKEGAIKGFTEYKEGRARAGVDLIV